MLSWYGVLDVCGKCVLKVIFYNHMESGKHVIHKINVLWKKNVSYI